MNSHALKIVKTAELPEPLEMGFDYAVAGRMAVVDINKHDEQDGTFTFTYKGQLTHIQVVNKIGKTVKAVAKGSKSQVLRYKIMEHGDNDFYEATMSKLIDNLDEVLELLNKK